MEEQWQRQQEPGHGPDATGGATDGRSATLGEPLEPDQGAVQDEVRERSAEAA